MKLYVRLNVVVGIIATVLVFMMTDCSFRHDRRRRIPWDDTIPRGSEPKPPATFYNGSFFQHYQVPKIVKPKTDTTKYE